MRDEASPELIERSRTDREAFGELYDCYLPRVYAFCRRYCDSREEAEDLTALTFERALAAITRYHQRDVPFSRWLLRIAANAIIDRSRRKGRAREVRESVELLRDDGHLEAWEEAYWLRGHVEALPNDQREVVRLRFYEDQRFQDVAARMGRSEGAVKQLLRRALRTLHARMKEGEEEGDDAR